MRFKIDWASLIVGRKFTVFALREISNYKPYIWRGDLTEGFLRYEVGVGGGGGLTFGGAYTWKGLFLEFYGMFLITMLLNLDLKIISYF